MRIVLSAVVIVALMSVAALPGIAHAEEVPVEYRAAIAKGLDWLTRNQCPDGHWEANGGYFPVCMTAMASTALLMEGSTLHEGKYRDNIRRAVNWLMAHTKPNGLIGEPLKDGSYMHEHGYALLFLSSVVGEEENADRRSKLVDILEQAVQFSCNAQSSRGGWTYISCKDANIQGYYFPDGEGSVTVTQLQGLRAARNAGIAVPVETIRNGVKFLRDTTNSDGGVLYCPGAGGGGKPALTAAAIVCGFSVGEYDSPLVKRWFQFCQSHLLSRYDGNSTAHAHDEYVNYYFAQAVYMLGEDGWAKLFPGDKQVGLKWSVFRKELFDSLMQNRTAADAAEGCWPGRTIGPVYSTALYLSILQLDKAVLPIYQR